MTQQPTYLTQEGEKKLRAELAELTGPRREELSQRLRSAIQMGDLSENADYHKAKEDQAFLEGRIQEIEKMLEMAELIDEKAAHASKEVRVGSTVSLRTADNKRRKYQVVGAAEANPVEGRISDESPVGRALLGKKRGDKVKVEAPAGVVEMTITSIS